ncbi:hypothetical protein OQA88_10557 [Cercophora sp. LCS_1]
MELADSSNLRQPWKEWYKPIEGPLGGRTVIPYMAAGNGIIPSGEGENAPEKPAPKAPEPEKPEPEEPDLASDGELKK